MPVPRLPTMDSHGPPPLEAPFTYFTAIPFLSDHRDRNDLSDHRKDHMETSPKANKEVVNSRLVYQTVLVLTQPFSRWLSGFPPHSLISNFIVVIISMMCILTLTFEHNLLALFSKRPATKIV